MTDYSFIREFQNIKISKFCKENKINLSNIINGTTTEENYRKVKNYILREFLTLMLSYKDSDLITIALYDELLQKLEKENKMLREMI